ncbi:MAG: mechanosensitive ion channel protein MscS [Opitutae bacterium]|nr:mechanosensitive ion channel protein MscS [Opitutae bacterium]|tara:strand:- start:3240 stop:4583 length:1344 start_codon:yes stop_codon:yes gene_type:complete
MGSDFFGGLNEEMIRGFFADESVRLQLAVVGSLLALSWLATKITKQRFQALSEKPDAPEFFKKAWLWAQSLVGPTYLLALCLLTVIGFSKFKDSAYDLITPATSVASAWAILRLISVFIKGRAWLRLTAVIVFTVAILHIFDLLQITTQALDSFGFNIGETRISFLDVINGGGILLGLLWGTAVLSRIVEKRVKTLPNVPPSLQVLLAKLVRMALIFFSVLIALSTVGLDLSSFALLGGAIGVGIGFGLQKVVSNLVSGLILLLDRSIKPGDVIEIDETYGWINSLRARYASVITRDGKEHLIPNEDLITNKVINWSFSHKDVRVRAPIGISYKSDPREAMELCLDAARAEPRVNNDPEPRCQLLGFGESSIQLELRFWIADPSNGVGNIRSSVLLGVWDRLKEAGISIPFPQRDLHLRSVSSGVPHQEAILQGKASSDSTKDQDKT